MINFIKPKFWDKKDQSLFSILLYPLSIIYYFIIIIKKKISITKKCNIYIICVGNIYVGGTGKTSTAIEVFRILEKYKKICFLTKGYGRKSKDDIYLNKKNYTSIRSENVGDESLLLNKYGPVYVANNRYKAIKNIIKLGYEVIILDDGFQDNSIHKNMNILCFDENSWIGNNNLIPAGPLREPIQSIKEAHLIIIKGKKNPTIEKEIKKIKNNLNIVYTKNEIKNIRELKNKKFIAFTGIGNPDNFFKLLLYNNIKITKTIIYPDHFQYTKKDYSYLLHEAKKNNCHLITTEKDYVRINSNYKKKFHYTIINTIFNKKKLIYNSFKKLHS